MPVFLPPSIATAPSPGPSLQPLFILEFSRPRKQQLIRANNTPRGPLGAVTSPLAEATALTAFTAVAAAVVVAALVVELELDELRLGLGLGHLGSLLLATLLLLGLEDGLQRHERKVRKLKRRIGRRKS